MTQRPAVLFVCLGNICRSPLAEAAFRKRSAEAGLCVDADSAGTADYHVGSPPDPRSIAEASLHGADISNYAGRQLHMRDFLRFTHILALDHSNLADVQALAPPDATARIGLLMDAVEDGKNAAVADPYHGNQDAFAETWNDVDRAARALVERFMRAVI